MTTPAPQREKTPAATTPRRRIWSEFTPYQMLRSGPLLTELSHRHIELVVAVTPALAATVVPVIRACQKAAVAVAIWPMLSDEQGRWASTTNAAPYCRFVRELLDALAAQDALPQALAVDLEPPIEHLRRLFAPQKGARAHTEPAPDAKADATARFAALTREVSARGLSILAAVVPLVTVPASGAARGWQRMLRTPVDELCCDRVSTMAYTSLLAGYSRGLLRRCDAKALLALMAEASHARYGVRASISLGAVGTGALGNEPIYKSPAELIEDVSIARAAGIDDLALFNLDGVLGRPPLADWLDALVTTPPAATATRMTMRASGIWHLLTAAGHLGRL